ncbi:ATPase family protein associated with various cellular activities (AAA) [Marinobacter sp. 3-2]|jgi:SpoVK/Ycf46/Vps4 family AAA+-type ATPase|uniref:AAA family ATPase n=1 Tax=Marinobacter sp. 3-2 TaxID=2485141 RepID=UPI000D3CFF0A|nr:AAA family ATPase [Marinobacter sp. 3-2]ROQ43339.1 ATPase family protein associated with various cellular activities (AAA) [Marinobacter sp. 3-2]
MNGTTDRAELFERSVSFPDFEARDRLQRLIGLDHQKDRLSKTLGLLVNESALSRWADKFHKEADQVLDVVLRRPPLVVLAGDVGSGKTELAETIGDTVARQEDIDIQLFPLSLSTRGQGRVGEMTQLISSAFEYVVEEGRRLKSESGSARGGIILLVDEADALAQSRENSQMHHEDKAGVNAFIRGIDRVATGRLPVAVVMCTNRLGALDPAIKRRCAEILSFSRPDENQRFSALKGPLSELGFQAGDIQKLVQITGPCEGRDFGYTFSDLTQRLIPSIVLDAYPNSAVSPSRALEVARLTIPTSPFRDE